MWGCCRAPFLGYFRIIWPEVKETEYSQNKRFWSHFHYGRHQKKMWVYCGAAILGYFRKNWPEVQKTERSQNRRFGVHFHNGRHLKKMWSLLWSSTAWLFQVIWPKVHKTECLQNKTFWKVYETEARRDRRFTRPKDSVWWTFKQINSRKGHIYEELTRSQSESFYEWHFRSLWPSDISLEGLRNWMHTITKVLETEIFENSLFGRPVIDFTQWKRNWLVKE